MNELVRLYKNIKHEIEIRISEFTELKQKASEERLFAELAFCLLTPQSKATVCWSAIEKLLENRKLFTGSEEEIAKSLKGVRFRNTKAKNIVLARELFTEKGKINVRRKLNLENEKLREWLVKNVRGMGYKEASHFLRNTGFNLNVAILDRHILRNLKSYGVIEDIPSSLTKKRYLELEEKFMKFADELGIPPAHLDLTLWYKETGFVFK